MKKRYVLLFVPLLAFALTSCGNNVESKDGPTPIVDPDSLFATIKWDWADGSTIIEDECELGHMPHYNFVKHGVPSKAHPTLGKCYVYASWDKEVTIPTEAGIYTYTAQYVEKDVPTEYSVDISCIQCTVNGREHLTETRLISDCPIRYHFAVPSGEFVHGYPPKGCVEVKRDGVITNEGYTYNEEKGDLYINELKGNLTITARADYSSIKLVYDFDATENTVTLRTPNSNGIDLVDWGDGTTSTTLSHTYQNTGDLSYNIHLFTQDANFEGISLNNNSGQLLSTGNKHIVSASFFGDNVVAIPDYAFSGCTDLVEIELGENIVKVGQRVFTGCNSLETFSVNEKNEVFISPEGSGSLVDNNSKTMLFGTKNAVIPNEVTTVASYAFDEINVASPIFPKSLKTIKANAFNKCLNIKEVTIPNGVEKIEDGAFTDCLNIISFDLSMLTTVPDMTANAADGIVHAGLYVLPPNDSEAHAIVREQLIDILGAANVVQDNPVAVIRFHYNGDGESADDVYSKYAVSCSLAFGIIGDIDWGDGTFTSFTASGGKEHSYYGKPEGDYMIRLYADEYTASQGWPITNFMPDYSNGRQITNTTELILNEGISSYYFTSGPGCPLSRMPNLRKLCFKEVDRLAISLADNTCLASLTVPSSLEQFNDTTKGEGDGFWLFDCPTLKSINVFQNQKGSNFVSYDDNVVVDTRTDTIVVGIDPTNIPADKGIKRIGDQAFQRSAEVKEIYIPEGIEYIGDEAFIACSSLERLYLPSTLTNTGVWICSQCPNLYDIFVADGNTQFSTYNNDVLINNATNTAVFATTDCREVPSTVTKIGDYAFASTRKAESISIPNVTSIGKYAFDGCSKLHTIDIGDKVTTIGSYAFANCSSLFSIKIPTSVTIVGGCAFNNCSSLKILDLRAFTTSTPVPTAAAYAFNKCSPEMKCYVSNPNVINSFTKSSNWPTVDAYTDAAIPETHRIYCDTYGAIFDCFYFVGSDCVINLHVDEELLPRFVLPSELNSIKVGGVTLSPEQYTYQINMDNVSGSITIPTEYCSGDVEFGVTFMKGHKITFEQGVTSPVKYFPDGDKLTISLQYDNVAAPGMLFNTDYPNVQVGGVNLTKDQFLWAVQSTRKVAALRLNSGVYAFDDIIVTSALVPA